MAEDTAPPGLPSILDAPRSVQTGNVLKLHDAEVSLMNSGPCGMHRLILMRSMDLMEQFPDMKQSDAINMGRGYVMLKIMGMNGQLTDTTRAELQRIENK